MSNRIGKKILLLGIVVLVSSLLTGTISLCGCHKHVSSGGNDVLSAFVRTWGGANEDSWTGGCIPYSPGIAVDSQDNSYVAGTTKSFGAGDTDNVVLKYNSAGSLQWAKTWGAAGFDDGNTLGGIALDSSNNIYVAGLTTRTDSTNSDAFLLRYQPDGTLDRAYTWGKDGDDFMEDATALVVDADNNVYVCGMTDMVDPSSDVFLFKVIPGAGVLALDWAVTWNNIVEAALALALDPISDTIYVTGATATAGGGTNCFLLKYDAGDGTLLWDRAWGTDDAKKSMGLSVAVDAGHNIYVAGICDALTNDLNIILLKYDSEGALLWERGYLGADGSANDEFGKGLVIDATSGNIYLGGMTYSGTGYAGLLLVYEPDGTLLEQKCWDGDKTDMIFGIKSRGSNLYLAGNIDGGNTWPADYTDTCLWQDADGERYEPVIPACDLGTIGGNADTIVGDWVSVLNNPIYIHGDYTEISATAQEVLLGPGTGLADQTYELRANIIGPTLEVWVDEDGEGAGVYVQWTRQINLDGSAAEATDYYTQTSITNTITVCFGDDTKGKAPPDGALIKAVYDVGSCQTGAGKNDFLLMRQEKTILIE